MCIKKIILIVLLLVSLILQLVKLNLGHETKVHNVINRDLMTNKFQCTGIDSAGDSWMEGHNNWWVVGDTDRAQWIMKMTGEELDGKSRAKDSNAFSRTCYKTQQNQYTDWLILINRSQHTKLMVCIYSNKYWLLLTKSADLQSIENRSLNESVNLKKLAE